MRALRIATVLPWLLLATGLLWAAPQYGEAIIEQGSMTIVREGKTLQFDRLNEPVPVNEEDLIRVRPDSLVQLKSREKATITLGANAVFQVKPWQARGKSGMLRALFGRFRSVVVGLTGGEQFNVKTATATIGVKGTENVNQVNNRGGAVSAGVDHRTYVQGQTGDERGVDPDHLSVALGHRPATPQAEFPPGFGVVFTRGLGAPPANSGQGGEFAGEGLLVAAGIVSQRDLDESRGGGEGRGPAGEDRGRDQIRRVQIDANAKRPTAFVPLSF